MASRLALAWATQWPLASFGDLQSPLCMFFFGWNALLTNWVNETFELFQVNQQKTLCFQGRRETSLHVFFSPHFLGDDILQLGKQKHRNDKHVQETASGPKSLKTNEDGNGQLKSGWMETWSDWWVFLRISLRDLMWCYPKKPFNIDKVGTLMIYE